MLNSQNKGWPAVSDKSKKLLISALVRVFQLFKGLGTSLLLFSRGLKLVSVFLYRFFFRWPFLLLYGVYRKTKKLVLGKSDLADSRPANFFSSYLPLAVMVVIGLTLIVSSLQARGLKPDNYGRASLLFKNLQSAGQDSAESDFDPEEIEEGPLLNTNSVSYYLAGDSLSADEADLSANADEGIDTLISTTQDESALIAPDITDPEVVVKTRDKIIDYVVQPGDVVSTIAAKFGVSINTLLWENNLTAYTTIRPGQTLKILPTNGVSHRVKKGDNLNAIAKKYQADAAKILEFNKIASLDDLQIDQILIIPGGVKQAAPQPSYTVKNIIAPPAQLSGAKMQWPTSSYRITQYFHLRHTGVDIGNKVGQPIYAAEGGVVEIAGWNRGGYGNYVIINHGNGFKTLYGHASKLFVTKGQKVSRGQVIAAIGSTGRSTGPHLHFEVISTGRKINPLGYIR